MHHPPDPSSRLLGQLGQGVVDDEDLDLLAVILRAEGLHDPPPWARARASRLAHPAPPEPSQAKQAIAWLAHLVFDSWSAAPALALRGPATGLPRQLLFRAPDAEVSLYIQPAGPRGVSVVGQVLGAASGAGQATLQPTILAGQTATMAATPAELAGLGPVEVDQLGEFHFSHVPLGRYLLALSLRAGRLETEPLGLGDSAEAPGSGAP